MRSTRRQLIPAIIIFLIGFAITIIGALFKVQHWPYGSEILTVGNLIEVAGIIVAIVILIKIYSSKK